MRTNTKGEPCPETLGEYHDYCAALKTDCAATSYFERKIAKHPRGREAKVLSPHELVMTCLAPMFHNPPEAKPKLVGFEVERVT